MSELRFQRAFERDLEEAVGRRRRREFVSGSGQVGGDHREGVSAAEEGQGEVGVRLQVELRGVEQGAGEDPGGGAEGAERVFGWAEGSFWRELDSLEDMETYGLCLTGLFAFRSRH